jgi:hypothetical protein
LSHSFISDACLEGENPKVEDASRNSDCSGYYVSVGDPHTILKTAAKMLERMLFTHEYAIGCLVGLADGG